MPSAPQRTEVRQSTADPNPAAPHLPEANEFSPGQVELSGVLRLASDHAENRPAIIEALRLAFFASAAARQTDPERRLKQQETRAYNVLVGMKGYGLFSFEGNKLSPLGEALLAEQDDGQRAEIFARHILLNTHGLEVLQAIQGLQSREVPVTKQSLADELRMSGFTTLPRATTHHTKLLQWLRTAGILPTGSYQVDEGRVAAITGVSLASVAAWDNMTGAQRAYLRTLRRIAETQGTSTLSAKSVLDQAEDEHGKIFPEDQMRAAVLRPLQDAGWLILTGVGTGRGGKQGRVAATPQLTDANFEALTGLAVGEIPADLRKKLNTPLAAIYADLDSPDTHKKGIALEVLAIRIAADIGLTPVRFRLRGVKTGGAEVDLLAEGAHLHFSRWLFQCKNLTGTVQLSDLAKEVGMAVLLHAHVIVLATRGRFAKSVQQYSRELSAGGPLQVVLLDGTTLDTYRESDRGALLRVLHKKAQATMRLKRQQVLDTLEDIYET